MAFVIAEADHVPYNPLRTILGCRLHDLVVDARDPKGKPSVSSDTAASVLSTVDATVTLARPRRLCSAGRPSTDRLRPRGR